uniref:Uncharacterized protein n=1 Tax=Anguilla anguilla TaxID=7936 RepID=A0A0E9XQM8_ANGAN
MNLEVEFKITPHQALIIVFFVVIADAKRGALVSLSINSMLPVLYGSVSI